MAFTSFTVRNTISDSGSALRRTNVTQDSSTPNGADAAIYDSGLRADGYFLPVPQEYLESTFSVNVYRRDEVELAWEIATPLVETPAGMSFEPVELLIRASASGEPVTANDGILVKSYTYSNYEEALTDRNRPYIIEGGWIYYSLFLKYADSTGDAFYEKVADLSVQIPINFQSTQALWKRIPTYYRELDYDYAINTHNYKYGEDGPLYRFIELFGWEMDRFRTTIYDTMRINDPDVVHSSAIDALAVQTGVEFGKYALGTTKLRTILNNIGYLRRSKGTQDSVEAYISALTGCGVSTRLESGVINFDVHPMRANLFTDPFFNQGVTSPDPADSGATQRKWTNLSADGRKYGWGVYAAFSGTPTNPMTVSNSGDKMTVTLPALSGTVTLLIYSRGEFAYNNNLTYYYSAVSSHNFTPRFVLSTALAGLEGISPPGSISYFDDWNNTVSEFPTYKDVLTNNTRNIVASIPSTSTVSSSNVIPVYKFDITLSATAPTVVTFQNPLAEYRNSSGDFFTGSTAMGGFIPNAAIEGDPSAGSYDYHWGSNASGTKDTDFSFYTLDFQRSKSVTIDVVSNYIMPVTLVNGVDYEINWEVLE